MFYILLCEERGEECAIYSYVMNGARNVHYFPMWGMYYIFLCEEWGENVLYILLWGMGGGGAEPLFPIHHET